VVLTHDLDFGAILAVSHGEKPSVVQVRSQDLRPEAIGLLIVNAIRQMTLELEHGALLTIDSKRTRLRILPLQSRD
jgi:predicted nuclease of predicted toxin-antitoxin system